MISETLFYKFTLEKTDLDRMKENAIGTADPNSPGLRVLGRVKAGKLAVRLCQHETIFFQPVVVRGLSSGINLGMAFFADRGWIIDARTRTVLLGDHCQVRLNNKHFEVW